MIGSYGELLGVAGRGKPAATRLVEELLDPSTGVDMFHPPHGSVTEYSAGKQSIPLILRGFLDTFSL